MNRTGPPNSETPMSAYIRRRRQRRVNIIIRVFPILVLDLTEIDELD